MRNKASRINQRSHAVSALFALLVGGAVGLALCAATDLGKPTRQVFSW